LQAVGAEDVVLIARAITTDRIMLEDIGALRDELDRQAT
jgi:hypothetical protein